jgi:hypothetical protein
MTGLGLRQMLMNLGTGPVKGLVFPKDRPLLMKVRSVIYLLTIDSINEMLS